MPSNFIPSAGTVKLNEINSLPVMEIRLNLFIVHLAKGYFDYYKLLYVVARSIAHPRDCPP